jgi:hypothetical protein
MRWGARSDANQKEIVQELKNRGVSVHLLSRVGGGCPDLLLGYNHRNYLVELKVKGEKLRQNQIDWHREWKGDAFQATCVEEIMIWITEPGEDDLIERCEWAAPYSEVDGI